MCGIFALLNGNKINKSDIEHNFQLGRGRGPESSSLVTIRDNLILGFHRLAINGLTPESDQPIIINGIYLICNGEIYNYQLLYRMMNNTAFTPNTASDCEVIIHLYIRYGFDQMLKMLDGVFAFILYDSNINKIYVARDYYGVRPLYMLNDIFLDNNFEEYILAFSSEAKMINEYSVTADSGLKTSECKILHFPPSTYIEISLIDDLFLVTRKVKYYNMTNAGFFYPNFLEYPEFILNTILQNINYYLSQAVYKRCITTERPIACLLSGGLDSSLITALVSKYYAKEGKVLETYSIGLADSEDLIHSRLVADYLGTAHTEIILTEEEFIEVIPTVIYAIESYDTTTVRASIGNYKLGEYIAKHSTAKVIFNGDGSDEVCGGYLYMENCPDPIEFDKECHRLLDEIHMYDVLRSDKCISTHGLEPRTPFLDKAFVQYYLSIPPDIRMPQGRQCTKFLLRSAFANNINIDSNCNINILPNEILWRRKEAFSDGVSTLSKSLYKIIQESSIVQSCKSTASQSCQIAASTENNTIIESINLQKEKKYYKDLFLSYFPNSDIIPAYWMPKYTNATDASARTLANYTL
jgi:asparagine synthase (glutamine-hydrolysing)